jgi:hypothetical protein
MVLVRIVLMWINLCHYTIENKNTPSDAVEAPDGAATQ